jgi:DNA-binding transcriptional LysR family regulator
MELYQLRSFDAVAAEGQLRRAAERLHLSQPAVSAHIKALEETLEVRLFERNSDGMALTSAGRALLELAHKALAAADEIRRAARALKGEIAGQLRIGTLSSPDFIRIGDLLARAVERHPRLELELNHEVSGEALQSVRDGSLDASFYLGDALEPDISGIPLRQLVFCVAAPAAWAERLRGAGWNEIVAEPWILTPPDGSNRQMVTELFAAQGLEPPARHVEADNEAVIASLVVAGVGVSLIRDELALEKQRLGEVFIWEKVRPRTTLWFIHRAERANDPQIAALLEMLRDVWDSPPQPVGTRRRGALKAASIS